MARFWKTVRLPGVENYEVQARYEHFGDAKGPGDIFVTWDLPDDKPQPTERQRATLCAFISEVSRGYDSAAEANRAWQRAVAKAKQSEPV